MNSYRLQNRLDNLCILRMDRKDPLLEIPSRLDIVDVLPHQMRRIEFEAETLAGNEIKYLLPCTGNRCKVGIARIVFPSHGYVQFVADRQVVLIEDLGQRLRLIFHGSSSHASAEGTHKFAPQTMP